MLAAVLEARNSIAVRDVPEPGVGPGEVKIAVGAAGICGTDVHAWLGAMEHRVPYPRILGHEFGGEVIELGRGVENVSIGDRVAVDLVFPCGACINCMEGHPNTCLDLNVFGIDSNGAMAERTVVRAERVHKLPDGFPMTHSIMAELYAVAVHAMRRTKIDPGDTVVILGSGRLGLACLDVASNCGARIIITTDLHEHRLNVAKQLGAGVTVNVSQDDPVAAVMEQTGGIGADKVVECIGEHTPQAGQHPPAWQAVEMVRPSGQITLLGQGPNAEPVPWRDLVIKEANIITSRLNLGDVPRAIGLMAMGKLHPERIITHELPLADAAKGFEMAHTGGEVIKVVLRAD